MLKPSIQLRLGQQLTMTPQLQQAIRLLQLSTLELRAEIQQTFENNPMLETVEPDEEFEQEENELNGDSPEPPEPPPENNAEEAREEANAEDEEPRVENELDSNWDEAYDLPGPYTGGSDDNYREFFENQSGAAESLQEHLQWQFGLRPLSTTDQMIGMAIIDAIDDDGYLSESLESIHVNLSQETEIDFDEVEAVLHMIQNLDPVASGSRDLGECLTIQLRQLPIDTPQLDEALKISGRHLELLAAHDFKQLMRILKLSEESLSETIALIQAMNPRPGAQINNVAPEYIIPDVKVFRRNDKWRVELNPDTAPRLRINSLYAGMIKRADQSKDNTYMRNQLQEARWFLKSLQSRNHTLLRVATAIVEHQTGFLELGEEAMQPLVLRDIADQLELHESTISRVTTQKYMHTPRGIYEFKYFFSSHVGTINGGACSATAIRAMIKKMVGEEACGKPLSDSKIAADLVSRGINVARRTVAKYRESMNIPPSNERKRLN